MLIGMAAAERRHKEAAGAATGFTGSFAYSGASLSGWPLAKVLARSGTGPVFAGHRHRGGGSSALLLPLFRNAQAPTRDQRSVMHLTFCAEWGKTKLGPFSCLLRRCRRPLFLWIFTMLAIRRYKN